MESTVQGTVLGVQGRTTKNGKTVYDVSLSDGNKYATFDSALATAAQQLTGQTVSAVVDVSQNGQWTNYYLNGIGPAGQIQTQPAAAPIPVSTPIPIVNGNNGNGMSPEREKKIVQQSSFSSAATIVAGLFQGAGPEAAQEAAQVWIDLAKTEFNIVMGVPTTPEAVAEAVNAEVAGAVVVGVGAEQPPTEAPTPQW